MQFLKSLLIVSAVTSMAHAADPDDNRWNNFHKHMEEARRQMQEASRESERLMAEARRERERQMAETRRESERLMAEARRQMEEASRESEKWFSDKNSLFSGSGFGSLPTYPSIGSTFGSSKGLSRSSSPQMTNQALQLRQEQANREAEQQWSASLIQELRQLRERQKADDRERQEKARREAEVQHQAKEAVKIGEQSRLAEKEQQAREAKEMGDLAEALRQQQLLQDEEKAREERETQEAIRAVAAFEAQDQKLKEEKPKPIIKDQDLILAGEWYKALSKMDQMNKEARVKCLKGHGFSEEYAKAVDDKLIGDDSEESEEG